MVSVLRMGVWFMAVSGRIERSAASWREGPRGKSEWWM